jgi:HEAT repeat protein
MQTSTGHPRESSDAARHFRWYTAALAIAAAAVTGLLLWGPTGDALAQRQETRTASPFPDRPAGVATTRHEVAINRTWQGTVAPGHLTVVSAPFVPGHTYAIVVALLSGDLGIGERFAVRLASTTDTSVRKVLHAGDPTLYFHWRPVTSTPSSLEIYGAGDTLRAVPLSVRVEDLGGEARVVTAIEAEPNDSWEQANTLELGRTVYGSADDVDYLDNPQEGKAGLDWFRLDFSGEEPQLVFFNLEPLEGDLASNLKLYRWNERTGKPEFYTEGKDPVEMIHDGQKVRYSSFLTRVLTRGIYYLQVNANHPAYVLRTTANPIPPYEDPRQAVKTAAHYVASAASAWHSQLPRQGDRFSRASVLHDGAVRCASCHLATFPAAAILTAKRAGYPITAKSQYAHVMERIYNSPAPLYGFDDRDAVSFVRAVGIGLQALGEQGSVVVEHEARVSGTASVPDGGSAGLRRWSRYLTYAWADRRKNEDVPAAEPHSRVSLDSMFGFALRDWRVLTEEARRTGDAAAAAAANNIRGVVTSPEATAHVKNMQERVLRLQALVEIGGADQRPAIGRAIDELFALQNPDGGWPDQMKTRTSDGTRSAEYLTGQIAAALQQAGIRADSDPRLSKALRWLQGRQRPFGGWFQTGETAENVRTPARETRYAIEALAAAHPVGPFRPGWENRSGAATVPAPGTAGTVETLDALDNVWQLSPGDVETLRRIHGYLAPGNPALVRSTAALAAGRVGDRSSGEALAALLGDPARTVSYSGAFALRQLATRGFGTDPVRGALQSHDPLVRRGAVQVFAANFYSLHLRRDLAEEVLRLGDDPDLLTRLVSSRALTEWWYRSSDIGFKKRITLAFLRRLGLPNEHPVHREGLIQSLYVLMDEATDPRRLVQWSSMLPPDLSRRVLESRKQVEREALLEPILAGLASDATLRHALLQSFDGTPWGRSYARYPYAASEVLNDREFEFSYTPPTEHLDRLFLRLLTIERDPLPRREVLQLAQFFRVPMITQSRDVQRAFLASLVEPDARTRAVAGVLVAKDLMLHGNEIDPAIIQDVRSLLEAPESDVRAATVALAARTPALLADEGVRSRIRATSQDPRVSMAAMPALRTDLFGEKEAMALVQSAWPHLRDERERLRVLGVASDLPGFGRVGGPVVSLAAADDSVRVRSRAYGLMVEHGSLRDDSLVSRGLEDPSPSIRSLAQAVTSASDAAPEGAPDLKYFKERVNPIFYKRGDDGRACASCHASRETLQLAEPPAEGQSLTEEDVRVNLESVLGVIDRADPARSLLVRKPVSPYGSGDADPESPTHFTHKGGDRWAGSDGSEYQTLLDWIARLP